MQLEIPKTLHIDDAVFFFDTLTKDKPYISVKPRNHDSFVFVTNGTLGYEKRGRFSRIKEGQVAYIAKGSTDKSYAYECNAVSYIAVNFNFDKNSALQNIKFPFDTVCTIRNSYKYGELFKKAAYEYSLNLKGSKIICNGILCQIIGALYNDMAYDNVKSKTAAKMEFVLDYINKNYHRRDFRISGLAQKIGISEKHFRRLFFDIYNKNPHEFLRDFRLSKAELLMLNTSKSISDIAIWCGFSDVYSFSHCFKQNFGISPKEYRQLQNQK